MKKSKRGGRREGAGRKPMDPALRRSEFVAFHVTTAELAAIITSAEERGLSISEYSRLRVLGQRLPSTSATRSAR